MNREYLSKTIRESRGFSLVEMSVVSAIVILLSATLFQTFKTEAQKTRTLDRATALITADLRKAQSLAASSIDFNDICGYGIHYVNSTTYLIYRGSDQDLTDCRTTDHNYVPADGDVIYQNNIKMIQTSVSFLDSFDDIFFEPPDPRVYVNDKSFPDEPTSTDITFCIDETSDCRIITVENGGRIETP